MSKKRVKGFIPAENSQPNRPRPAEMPQTDALPEIASSRSKFRSFIVLALASAVSAGALAISRMEISKKAKNSFSTPRHSEITPVPPQTTTISGKAFEISSTAQQREKLKDEISKALQFWRELDVDVEFPNPEKPFPIIVDETIGEKNATTHFQPVFTLRDALNVDDPAATINSVPITSGDARYIKIKIDSATGPTFISLAHEIFHVLTASIPNGLWREGMAKGINLMLIEKHFSNGSPLLTTSEAKSFQEKHEIGFDTTPLNGFGTLRSCIGKPTFPEAEEAAGIIWHHYFKNHPEFLKKFIAEIRRQCGVPQTKMPSERMLIEMATSIDPTFKDWYSSQRIFQHPNIGERLKGHILVPNTYNPRQKYAIVYSSTWGLENIACKELTGTFPGLIPDTMLKTRVTIRESGKDTIMDGDFEQAPDFRFIKIDLPENTVLFEYQDNETGKWIQVEVK